MVYFYYVDLSVYQIRAYFEKFEFQGQITSYTILSGAFNPIIYVNIPQDLLFYEKRKAHKKISNPKKC